MALKSYDDRDNTNLKYLGFWGRDSTYNATSAADTGTLATTNDPNANITFNFPEPASGIRVWGMKRSRGGQYGICIDCDLNAPNFETIDGLDTSDNGKEAPELLYTRTFSTPGYHVVILRNEQDPRGTPAGNSQLAFDRFELEVQGSSSSSSSSQTSQAGPSSSSSGPISSSSSGPTSTSSPESSGLSGGVIGGITAGAVVLVALLVALIFLLLRRKQRRTLPPPTPSLTEAYGPMSEASYRTGTATGYPISSSGSSASWPQKSAMNRQSVRVGASTGSSNGRTAGVSREVDAGPVNSAGTTLPPEYGHWNS